MSKSSRRSSSRISEHKRRGKQLRPPLMAMEGMTLQPWLQDVLPDMLWSCFHMVHSGQQVGMQTIAQVQDLVAAYYEDESAVPIIDGRLTSFERIPLDDREPLLSHLNDAGLFEAAFPEAFQHVLGLYDAAPARWLIEPTVADGFAPDVGAAEATLSELITRCGHGQADESTWAKAMALRGLMVAGKLHIASHIRGFDLLPRYPHDLDEDERKQIEATIRASFHMVLMMPPGDEDQEPPYKIWAQQFWRANWELFDCRRAEHSDDEHQEAADDTVPDALPDVIDAAATDAMNSLTEAHRRVLTASSNADPDLYAPSRHEVLTGLAMRAIRVVSAFVHSPMLWSSEHGALSLRAVVEVRISLAWMIKRDDERIYDQFKAYGRGQLKLLKLKLEEFIDQAAHVPDEYHRWAEELDRAVNWEIWEEFQDIELGAWSKKNTRDMAREAGLSDEYSLLFQPLSSIAHAEWSALTPTALEICTNPTHRYHHLPANDMMTSLEPGILDILLDQLDRVVDLYEEAMRPADGS